MPHIEARGFSASAALPHAESNQHSFSLIPVMESVTPLGGFKAPNASLNIPVYVEREIPKPIDLALAHIPLPEDRPGSLIGSGVPVIRHEVGHALAGKLQGLDIQYLDFNPDSDGSIARVFFTSPVDSITAGAGAALGGSFGTGGDQQTVAYLHADWDTSVSNAAFLINSHFPIDVQGKIIELTTFVSGESGGHIPGSLFDQIVLRAFQEVDFKDQLSSLFIDKNTIDTSRAQWKMEIEESLKSLPQNYIKDSFYENGDIRRDIILDGKITETHIFCGVCGGKDGFHFELKHQEYEARNNWMTTTTIETEFDQPQGVLVERSLKNPLIPEDDNLLTILRNPIPAQNT